MKALIINKLEKIMSRQEAQIYLYLLENPGQTVYYIAKALTISRSSIYPVVDAMYSKGFLLKLSTAKDAYYPENPNTLIRKLRQDYNQNFDELQDSLQNIKPKADTNYFFNIANFDANLEKAKELLLKAEKEIYLNCDLDLEYFAKEFQILANKNVRIIVFSFSSQELVYPNIETYSYGYDRPKKPSRLMVVSDFKEVLVASAVNKNDDWIGTITNNHLMVKIVSEHIHHDIYLYKIQNMFQDLTGKKLFVRGQDDLFLNTLNENTSFFDEDKEKKQLK
ncbi:MAG TPA: helix-turn-helix domain-containing protein [Bacilli bacterium]|nr:helix-turn-helix domain-containing protein [Bacilli bacterium]